MSVEAANKTRTIRRNAMRQVHRPEPLMVLDPNNLEPAIAAALRQVRTNQNSRQCGSYVFIDRAKQLFVIREDSSAAPRWIRECFVDLVGLYAIVRPKDPRIPTLKPTPEGLAEDFADHLRLIGVAA